MAGFAVTLSNRNVVGVDVIRDRNALFRERSDGRIENVYNVKILNKDREAHEFRIAGSGLEGLEVDYAGPTVWVGPGRRAERPRAHPRAARRRAGRHRPRCSASRPPTGPTSPPAARRVSSRRRD